MTCSHHVPDGTAINLTSFCFRTLFIYSPLRDISHRVMLQTVRGPSGACFMLALVGLDRPAGAFVSTAEGVGRTTVIHESIRKGSTWGCCRCDHAPGSDRLMAWAAWLALLQPLLLLLTGDQRHSGLRTPCNTTTNGSSIRFREYRTASRLTTARSQCDWLIKAVLIVQTAKLGLNPFWKTYDAVSLNATTAITAQGSITYSEPHACATAHSK